MTLRPAPCPQHKTPGSSTASDSQTGLVLAHEDHSCPNRVRRFPQLFQVGKFTGSRLSAAISHEGNSRTGLLLANCFYYGTRPKVHVTCVLDVFPTNCYVRLCRFTVFKNCCQSEAHESPIRKLFVIVSDGCAVSHRCAIVRTDFQLLVQRAISGMSDSGTREPSRSSNGAAV